MLVYCQLHYSKCKCVAFTRLPLEQRLLLAFPFAHLSVCLFLGDC